MKKKYILIGAAALAAYFLLRNSGRGTTVMKENGEVDTKAGFDGTKAKNLAPDIYGRQIGRDVFNSFTGTNKMPWGNRTFIEEGIQTTNISDAFESSVKMNRYKVDVPKIL